MTVIINQLTKSLKVKTTSGKLISDDLGFITAVVYDKKGSGSIKRFQKSKIANYTIVD